MDQTAVQKLIDASLQTATQKAEKLTAEKFKLANAAYKVTRSTKPGPERKAAVTSRESARW